MKGIILAGGTGSRLYPATFSCCKQLLNVYDKPMVYYPLSILLLLQLKEILIISTEKDILLFRQLFKTGEQLGVTFQYKVQKEPRGIADAFIVGEEFIKNEKVCLILGDNLIYGKNLKKTLNKAASFKEGAVVFGYCVKNPKDFGVVELNEKGEAVSIEEKPKNPKSNYAVVGLYFYDSSVVEIAKSVKKSKRGELEISSVNDVYLKNNKLKVELFEKDVVWQDTGTHKELLNASIFVRQMQQEDVFVGCLEEIAFENGFINKEQLLSLAKKLDKTEYGKHLLKIAEGE